VKRSRRRRHSLVPCPRQCAPSSGEPFILLTRFPDETKFWVHLSGAAVTRVSSARQPAARLVEELRQRLRRSGFPSFSKTPSIDPNWVTTAHPLSLFPVNVDASQNGATKGVVVTHAGIADPVFRARFESRDIPPADGSTLFRAAETEHAALCLKVTEIRRVLGRSSQ